MAVFDRMDKLFRSGYKRIRSANEIKPRALILAQRVKMIKVHPSLFPQLQFRPEITLAIVVGGPKKARLLKPRT